MPGETPIETFSQINRNFHSVKNNLVAKIFEEPCAIEFNKHTCCDRTSNEFQDLSIETYGTLIGFMEYRDKANALYAQRREKSIHDFEALVGHHFDVLVDHEILVDILTALKDGDSREPGSW